jgi:hypothetical protein
MKEKSWPQHAGGLLLLLLLLLLLFFLTRKGQICRNYQLNPPSMMHYPPV